ncbi:hypothetical protein HQ520_02485 [bacterium]|nr:hypothetical protein [bacterium]
MASTKATLTSREVLSDAQRAWQLLEGEFNSNVFRIYWVAAISLCRSVGYVLDKVDSKNHPQIAEFQKSLWAKKKNDRIFHEFIDSERNAILKEYVWNLENGTVDLIIERAEQESSLHILDDCMFCPIHDGGYSGEDCRDVLCDALNWWDAFLAQIEQRL